MDIAIKYEKINLGQDKFIFKPVSIISGEYDKETNIFVTDFGDLCEPIDGENQYEDNYFAHPTTIEELKKIYKTESEEEALIEFYDKCSLYYTLGYYDHSSHKIQILNVPSMELERLVEQSEIKEEIVDISPEEIEDITINLSIEQLKQLRETKDKNDINSFYKLLDQMIAFAEGLNKDSKTNVGKESEKYVKPKKEKETKLSLKKQDSIGITLAELRKDVLDVIKGQDKAVSDVTRGIIVNQMSDNPRHKSHMLILGPSGTGKTEMVNIISKRLGIPFFKADATAYTKEGYVGKSVYSMFSGLIQSAGGDIKKAENGILIIDEIDKKLSPRKDDVGGVDVLNSLLKIMDRDIIELDIGKGSPLLFDTSNLTIIFMGAFADLYKSKEEGKNKKIIGFGTVEESKKKEKITVNNEDLIKAGMPPEFLGRIPIVTNTEELELEDLVEILYKSKGGAIDEEKEFCKGLGVTVKFTSGYMREIARKAHESKTGARNLRKLVRESLSDAYDEILSGKDVKELKLTKKTAIDSKIYCTN